MKQIPLAIGDPPQSTFDNFVIGANAAAVAHLAGLSDAAAPVYLWGPAGSGKTHLLRALAERRQALGHRVGWFDATDPAPWELAPDWTLVIVDGCERLDLAAQHAAFTLFVEAATLGVPLVASGCVPPVDLEVRDDLRTRLGWGHVFALLPLSESETRAAMRREADRRGIFLSDEVMDYLLARLPRDLSHLMGLLDRLDEFGLARGRRVSVPLVREMLAEEGGATAPGQGAKP